MSDPLAEAAAHDLRLLAPGAGDDALAAAGADLAGRWREPHRRYHDARHLLETLAALTRLAGAQGLPPGEVAIGRVAVWFHDAVHDAQAGPGADEEASAVLAVDVLDALGAPLDAVEQVAALVAATANHAAAQGDSLMACVLDADLAILGADEHRFDEYCAQVRAEYAHVPDDAYARGRSAILAALTEPYRTASARAWWGEAAAANLAREQARLARP